MNARNTLRRSLTAMTAIGAALALSLSVMPGAAASGNPALPDGSDTATLQIRKHESPANTTLDANGMPIPSVCPDPEAVPPVVGSGLCLTNPAVEGAQFTIRRVADRVPVLDIDGNPVPDGEGNPTFTLVPLDFTTRAGWERANEIMRSGAWPWADGINQRQAVTDANGAITFTGLELGLWMVMETATPTGVLPGAPFFVTLPMTNPVAWTVPAVYNDDVPPVQISPEVTHPAGTAWMYEVWVYPKNATAGFTKTVQDGSSFAIGDSVRWEIIADVPTHADDYRIDRFTVVDVLDTRLNPVHVTPTPNPLGRFAPSVRLVNPDPAVQAAFDASPIELDVHFTVTWDATDREWTVNFTQLGLDVLGGRDADPDALPNPITAMDPVAPNTQVEIIFTTYVNATFGTGDSSGVIHNDARFYPNNRSYVDNTPLRDRSETRYGGIDIIKVEAGNDDPDTRFLEGAVFQVFRSRTDAEAQANPIFVPGQGTSASNATDGSFWVTGSNGRVQIDGLRASNFVDGALLPACLGDGTTASPWARPVVPGSSPTVYRDCFELDAQWYYLVEVVAPEGMSLLAEPVPFRVIVTDTRGEDCVTIDDVTTCTPTGTITRFADQTITNVPNNAGFRLPAAGGIGTTILMYAGVVLAIAGVTYGVVSRRRAHAAA